MLQDNFAEGKLNKLLKEVQKHRIQFEDHYEIAAILESNGWNDVRAAKEFGADDIFALAKDLWHISNRTVECDLISSSERMSVIEYTMMVIRSFLRGMIFALPMAISVLAMLTLRFSLWSYVNLSLELATSIAIGTIMSFIAIGGFTQAIARRGFMYIKQSYYNMARRITFYFVKIGYAVCFLIAILFLLFNTFFSIFPFRMTIIIVAYFFFLSAIWLSVTIMYILEKELAFTGLVAGGIFLVFIFFRVLNMNIIISQIIALIIVSILGIVLALYFFIKAEEELEKGISPSLPRLSITIYTILPYFAYGLMYFTFLYADRVIAWSTNNLYMPYIIWFRGAYELGLDFALLALIVPMGVIEVVCNEFMLDLSVTQKNYLAEEAYLFNQRYLRMYFKRIIVVGIFSIISAIGIYIIIRMLSEISIILPRTDLLANDTTHFVFIIAAISYALLAVGLMNALILFSVSQPEMVCRAITAAFIVNIIIGFLLSRWLEHEFAVIGLLVGALIFLFLSSKSVTKVLNNLDYYLYAAA